MVKLRVMGIDVEPGCSRHTRCYSVVVLDSHGSIIAKFEHVPLHRLVRLIWDYNPELIAIDNVYELASNEKELIRFVSLLPDNTSIVQVTMSEDGTLVDLKTLANAAGIEVSGKLSPVKTAYVVAKLALQGYGVKIRFLEEKTKIVIARSRSPGKGGSSSSRFQRNIRANILRIVKNVKKVLDRHGFDYDLLFRKSGGGLDSAVFIVYAPRDKLYGLIKPHDDGIVRVEIKPVYASHIVFERRNGEASTTKRYLIVGVDPGLVTGVAALDLNGRVVFVTSRRGLDRHEVVELINKYGVALIIATDVKPAPEYVKKLASILGAHLFEPPEPLTVEEKRELVSKYVEGLRLDSHERDALAAAIKAYHYYLDKVKQIETSLNKYSSIDIDAGRIIASVIKGITIAEAVENEIARLLYSDNEQGVLVKRVRHNEEKRNEKQSPHHLNEAIEKLRAENIHLRNKIKELKARLEELEMELKLARSEMSAVVETERRVSMLKHEVELLRNEVEKLRDENMSLAQKLDKLRMLVLRASSNDYYVAPVIPSLSKESVKELEMLKPKLIVLKTWPSNNKVLENLKRIGVKIIITPSPLAAKLQNASKDILIISDSVVEEEADGIALINLHKLGEELVKLYDNVARSSADDTGFDIAKLKKLFEEYRARRVNELLGELEDA